MDEVGLAFPRAISDVASPEKVILAFIDEKEFSNNPSEPPHVLRAEGGWVRCCGVPDSAQLRLCGYARHPFSTLLREAQLRSCADGLSILADLHREIAEGRYGSDSRHQLTDAAQVLNRHFQLPN